MSVTDSEWVARARCGRPEAPALQLTDDLGSSPIYCWITSLRTVFAAMVCQLVPGLAAAEASMSHEDEPEESGLILEAAYTSEIWRNVSGGIESGGVYLDNLDVTLELALESLWNIEDTRAFVYGLYNNGQELSGARTGDLKVISNIETGVEAARLYEAWIETGIGERGSVRFGLYDLNSEFDVLESAGLFIHSAHGIGADFGQTGRNGPSIFPVTSLGLRVAWELTDHWRLRSVVLDGVPGDPDDPGATAIQLGNGDGVLLASELDWQRGGRRVLLGAWGYTARFSDWRDALVSQTSDQSRGNVGAYVRGEAAILGEDSGVRVFGRYGIAASRYNVLDRFFGTGVEWVGPLPKRPQDALGLAVAWGAASDEYRPAVAATGADVDRREVAFELTYRFPLGERVVLQPDLQYVVNPGLDPSLDNVFAVGLRVEMGLVQ